jgi:hypothetical protein
VERVRHSGKNEESVFLLGAINCAPAFTRSY